MRRGRASPREKAGVLRVSRIHVAALAAFVVPTVLGLGACASTTKQAQSVQDVDELLTRIERVQVEATLAKDKAREALVELTTLVAPGFSGDATKQFATLEESIEASQTQAQTFRNSITPMTRSADDVFSRWTKDLESFGNTRMRQRSQTRLDETRARYQTVLTSSQAVLVSVEAFNADLEDQALFLASDLNASAVQAIHPEVRSLHERAKELDGRVETCSDAARAYVESAALYGQVEAVVPEAQPAPNDSSANNPANTLTNTTERPTKTKFAKPRSSTLKPRTTANPTPETPVESETPPPAPEPEVQPQ